MNNGITGRDLGIKINELEIESFKKMLKESYNIF
jgi:hypothetical protein